MFALIWLFPYEKCVTGVDRDTIVAHMPLYQFCSVDCQKSIWCTAVLNKILNL